MNKIETENSFNLALLVGLPYKCLIQKIYFLKTNVVKGNKKEGIKKKADTCKNFCSKVFIKKYLQQS